MYFSSSLAAAASFAGTLILASPTAIDIRSRNADKIQLKWIVDLTSKKVSIDIYTKDSQLKLLETPLCQDYVEGEPLIVNSDSFATTPILLNISTKALGEISYAGKTYVADTLPESNGGVYCTSMYSPEAALLDCQIPWASAKTLAVYSIDNSPSCFLHGSPAASMDSISRSQVHARSEVGEQPRSLDTEPKSNLLASRAPPVCPYRIDYRLWGNGDPHDLWLQVQLTDVLSCGDGTCTISHQTSTSFELSWSFTGAYTGSFISGGLGVSSTVTTGQGLDCDAGPGQSVCIWSSTKFIEYHVIKIVDTGCAAWKEDPSQTAWLRSPVSPRAVSYYCVRGACRTRGERYWA